MGKILYAETADVFPGIIARNKAVLDYEKFVHRTFYPYIIHPYSRFRVYWELFMVVLNPVKLTVFFFFWAFTMHNSLAYQFSTASMQLLSFVDIVLMFFTGYVESKTEIVVLDPKKIAQREECVAVSGLTIKKECQLLVFLSAIGFFCGIGTFARYLKNTAKVLFWNPYLPSLISITYYFFLVIIFNFAFLFMYELYLEHSLFIDLTFWEEFLIFVHILISFCFDIVFLNITFSFTHSSIEIPVLVLNFFFGIFCTVYFIKYIIGKMKARERFFFLENRVKSFARKKNLPFILRKKTLLYFQILLKNKYHREDEIFNYVPDTFKGEIFFHFCLPLLKGFHAFENYPTYVLRRLAECLRYQLYLPNELVISKKEPMLSMYFIQKGTVALYSAKHVELYHFEAGSSICGKYFIRGKPLINHFAFSIEVTEVYRLDYEDFMEIMASYPKLLSQTKNTLDSNKKESYDIYEDVFES